MVDASLLESKIGHVSRKDDLFMLGPYGARQFQLDFCVKHRINGEPLHNNPATTDWHKKIRETTEWPRGSYLIHQMTKNCPEGKTASFRGSGPDFIKLFSCSTQLSTKFQLLRKTKILTNKEVSRFKFFKCCIYHTNEC